MDNESTVTVEVSTPEPVAPVAPMVTPGEVSQPEVVRLVERVTRLEMEVQELSTTASRAEVSADIAASVAESAAAIAETARETASEALSEIPVTPEVQTPEPVEVDVITPEVSTQMQTKSRLARLMFG